jgi:two-component system cell cycle response regulator
VVSVVEDKPEVEGHDWDIDSVTVTHQLPLSEAPRMTGRGSPSLVVVSGYALGTIYPLEDEVLVIGRDPANAIVVDDVGASRRHCEVERLGERVVARDLESKNGTFVNDDTVTEQVLVDGDLIHVGRTTYKFLAGNSIEQSYYEGLHNVAMQDALTELPNRRYFDEVISRELARARRHSRTLVMLMADIDHFKNINDTYGHVAGDMVLREFARLLRPRVRTSEFFARYGGEEFAFVLPESDLEGAMIFAEAVRRKVEVHPFLHGDTSISVTVSIGGACFGSEIESVKQLIEVVDKKLYEAKDAGRNTVCF